MSKINDGGPAFPVSHSGDYPHEMVGGMSLRDYFAAAALSGASASDTIYSSEDAAAKDAYRMADAMLRAREVQP